MRLVFKIGAGSEAISVPDQNMIAVLNPASLPDGINTEALIQNTLDNPIGTKRLEKIVHPGEKTVIVISDMTRPCPSYRFLPLLIHRLQTAGLRYEDIQIVIARGSHRKCTEAEKKKLTGEEIYEKIVITNSGDHGYVSVGTTSRGTPVELDRDAVDAKHRILTGNVEFHYFAGFSGGAKALMPGCADPKCIAYNHRFMIDEKACAGQLEGNPVREDLEEAAGIIGTDFILNVVLNTKKEIIYAVAGDIRQAHRDACAHLSHLYLSPVSRKADIVIVSQGGTPKDLNLYQTQKALDNAKYAVKNGGTIILIGSCEEGFGNPVFERWMKSYSDPDAMISHLHTHFELGGHKAAAIALVRKKADIYLVSNMEDSDLEGTLLKPFAHLEDAYKAALRKQGPKAEIIAMPYGGSTLPIVQ